MALVADHLTVGLGQRVDDITGSGNSRDSVCIAGFVENDFVWTSAKRNTAPDQALGYYGCAPTIVDATFTIPGGADAYVGGISLQGAALDATAGDIAIHASTITTTDSASRPSAVDLRGVHWTPFDPSTNNWIRMSVTSASGEGTFNATGQHFHRRPISARGAFRREDHLTARPGRPHPDHARSGRDRHAGRRTTPVRQHHP